MDSRSRVPSVTACAIALVARIARRRFRWETVMKRSTGLLILVALGALDIFWLVSVPFLDTPVPVGIIGGVLGIVTLAAARPAWGGNRAATIAVLATRVLSALVLDLPAYFFDDTPGWALVVVSVAIALTIVGIAMVASTARARAAQPA
jgi:hypothetical protein